MVVEEHHHHHTTNEGSGNGFAWAILLIVLVLIAWFVFRSVGTGSRGGTDINVTLPEGGTSGTTGGATE